jgi:hypothetical protein
MADWMMLWLMHLLEPATQALCLAAVAMAEVQHCLVHLLLMAFAALVLCAAAQTLAVLATA